MSNRTEIFLMGSFAVVLYVQCHCWSWVAEVICCREGWECHYCTVPWDNLQHIIKPSNDRMTHWPPSFIC